jgi:hypothetical protein
MASEQARKMDSMQRGSSFSNGQSFPMGMGMGMKIYIDLYHGNGIESSIIMGLH